LSVHTDDILLTASPTDMVKIKKEMSSVLTLKWPGTISGEWTRFLGYDWRRRGCILEVRVPHRYIQRILDEWKLERAKAAATPFQAVVRSKEEDVAVDEQTSRRYHRAVGQLLWLISVRPDLNFCIKELARHANNATEHHELSMRRCLKFLKGTAREVCQR
jgi:hypothetical protein